MFALDPIHIGTGGYQIGRVDNTIVREPATNIPKIPGSSIAGTARTYATYRAIENENSNVTINCAGQDKEGSINYEKNIDKRDNAKNGHCGECIICKSFGFSKSDDRGSSQGLVYFSDAHILLFPVSTRCGPAWITSPMLLEDFDVSLTKENIPADNHIAVNSEFYNESSLNLGWINLPIEKNKKVPSLRLDSFTNKKELISKRIVVVPNKLVSQIINSNLEVRTSVSIDPVTGAGISGALFTSEAIPRSSILWFDVNINDPKYFGYEINNDQNKKIKDGNDNPKDKIKLIVEGGFGYFKTLGIGGMITRGFGRVMIEEVK